MFNQNFQGQVADWSHRNFGGQPAILPLLGVVEEVGELAHAELKGIQGIRHTPEEIDEMKIDAVGDIVIYLADYCVRSQIDLGAAIQITWNKVRVRDWINKPLGSPE